MTRRYDDGCAASYALDIVGDRWALAVVRELMWGPRRFVDLQHDLGSVSTSVLTARLRQLQGDGLVTKQEARPGRGAATYALTAEGARLRGVLLELGRWGAASPRFDPARPPSVAAAALAVESLFLGGDGAPETTLLEVEDVPFTVVIRDVDVSLSSTGTGGSGHHDLHLVTDPGTLVSLLMSAGPAVHRAIAESRLDVPVGSARLAEAWFGAFGIGPATARGYRREGR